MFPPANPSNFSHCNVSIRIPFLFQYISIIVRSINEMHKWNVERQLEEAVGEDRTGLDWNYYKCCNVELIIMLNSESVIIK